jgi:Tfp pilus assembly protein PilE
MRQMTSKRIGSHRLYSFRRQKGVSLIPALITICIFTLLATQVVIPNQNRNIRETNINAVASSVEQLIQATYAYRAASASHWGNLLARQYW